ncbi:mesothelin-like [Spea bombifrons]|uniref:mesothelin-like n=1 Tax=Spea bombifrons TaxID=233779 RepID=UPI0023494D8D|nr:mesothelin-like [Spea bombifrons]
MSKPSRLLQQSVKGFSLVYGSLSADTRQDIFNHFIKIYLSKKASSNDSMLMCGKNETFQTFVDNYLMAFSAILDSEKLVSLIQSGLLSQKLNTLLPNELLRYLNQDTSSIHWEIILSHYTEISNLSVLMDLLKTVNMSSATTEAVLRAVWPTFLNSLESLSGSELDTWLSKRFSDYLHLISKKLLNVEVVLNASCSFYKNLVNALSIHYWNYTTSTHQDIYSVFKTYLLRSDTKPRCYVSSDEGAASWIFTYLGDYLTHSTPEDLRLFTNNVTLLQDFSVDQTCLALIERLNLSEELKIFFSELIASKDPSISLTKVPRKILCYIIGKLNIGSVGESQALATANILKNCSISNITLGNDVLASLLSSVSTFTAETLGTLGSLAGALSPTAIIEKTTGSALQQSLPTLSKIETWSVAQASSVVKKITEVGFTINATSLGSLGSLVIGLEANTMDNLTSADISALANNTRFVSYMEQATTTLRQRFVQQVIQVALASKKNIFQVVPANLASEIPVSRLIMSINNVQELGQMKWTTSQAQVFFQKVMDNVTDYSNLSVNILQGFTCGATNSLNNSQFQSLIKSMKNVTLQSSQLSCATKRLTNTDVSTDFKSYPSDVLLFIGSSSNTFLPDCKDYFSLLGKSNIDLLPRTSPIRTTHLTNAKTCLKISGTLTKDNLETLGFLACDLTASEIIAADPYILTVLRSCSSFTDLQKPAINSKIININGNPGNWTISTLKEIGNLASILSTSTLQQLPMALKIEFFPNFLGNIKIKYKTSFSYIMKQLKESPISTRALPSCTNLTTDIIVKQKDFIAVSYPSSALETCLDASVMVDNLDTLGSLAFDDSQLLVLRKKLDVAFTNGIPEDYLLQLGNIARMYSTDEIAKWNITRLQTLSSLIEKGSWESNDTKVNALVSRYLQQPRASLDGTTLTILAPKVCSLSGDNIGRISSDAIGSSTVPMDTSTCSQTNKNILFSKLKSAYQSFADSKYAYYLLLQPAIGGARAADLIQLSKDSPNMDINVFAGLNPEEVKNLAASTIKDLLGQNVADLSSIASSDLIKGWVAMNTQTAVNLLGLNLPAGVKEPTPNGFIVLDLATQPSGAAPCHISSILLFSTAAFVVQMISPFL